MTTYAERRERLFERIGTQGVAIVMGARELRRNGTNTFRFRQASDLLYLTGFEEPDAIAVFTPGKAKRFSLFLKPRDLMRENWTGKRMGVDEVSKLGADQAFPLTELEPRLAELVDGCADLYVHSGDDAEADALLLRILRRLRQNERNGSRAPQAIRDLALTLHELRLVKDADGLSCLRRAAEITAEAHLTAMRAARHGRREYELEALIDYVFRKNDGFCGYDTIVGCGNNATTLHYTGGGAALNGGEMLLVDAGCEYGGYTADVTRSYPVPKAGQTPAFTVEQRRFYELVLHTQAAGIAAARPGATIEDVHDACVKVATAGMVDIGLLTGDPAELIAKHHYRRFYVHRTSHFLGMDVHDVGTYFPGGEPRRLLPGMVFTIEPGLYIRQEEDLPAALFGYRGLGVRIEDDVLIDDSPTGHEVLTRAIPKHPDELLRIVGSGVTIAL